jgi:pyruvate formate lyase activating enzyme
MSLFFDVKRYAIHDGPGIRITLFFKGCPLSCVWCHNPEGISPRKQKMYTRKKCIGCQTCVANCPAGALQPAPDGGIRINHARCLHCGNCDARCPAKALETSGAEYSVDYLMSEIEKETVFMDQSGGGVTFCGGEPLAHAHTLLQLLRRCGERGVHRAVDTTLFAPQKTVVEVMKETDLFLADLKHMDSQKHRLYCGVPNERILANLRLITGAGKQTIVRIPLIEGINADEANISRSAAFLASLPWADKTVCLLPYHAIAAGKCEKLGAVYNPASLPMSPPTPEVLERCASIFRAHDIKLRMEN